MKILFRGQKTWWSFLLRNNAYKFPDLQRIFEHIYPVYFKSA
jgi:hypothetical protein